MALRHHRSQFVLLPGDMVCRDERLNAASPGEVWSRMRFLHATTSTSGGIRRWLHRGARAEKSTALRKDVSAEGRLEPSRGVSTHLGAIMGFPPCGKGATNNSLDARLEAIQTYAVNA